MPPASDTSPLALRPREAARALSISPRCCGSSRRTGTCPAFVSAAASGGPSSIPWPNCKPGSLGRRPLGRGVTGDQLQLAAGVGRVALPDL